MAEVKTYKCDICGEVYHVEELHIDSINIVHKIMTKDEADSTYYKHICPHCQGVILEIIRNPDAIEKMDQEISELHEEANKKINKLYKYSDNLEVMIKQLNDKTCGYNYWPCLGIVDDHTNYFKRMCDDIGVGYSKIVNSRNMWRASALGLLTGMMIAFILALIF